MLLPFDGAALTDVAHQGDERRHPGDQRRPRVRHARSPPATTILGDNYGMGVSAGTYICEQLDGQAGRRRRRDRRHRLAAADPGPQPRASRTRSTTAASKVDNRVAAEFTVESGEAAASNLLQAAPKIDALWNHDDDQGVGVLAAIENAGRDEFFMVGGAGSANAMEAIKADDTVLKATVIYPSTQAADGIRLARLLAQGKAHVATWSRSRCRAASCSTRRSSPRRTSTST